MYAPCNSTYALSNYTNSSDITIDNGSHKLTKLTSSGRLPLSTPSELCKLLDNFENDGVFDNLLFPNTIELSRLSELSPVLGALVNNPSDVVPPPESWFSFSSLSVSLRKHSSASDTVEDLTVFCMDLLASEGTKFDSDTEELGT